MSRLALLGSVTAPVEVCTGRLRVDSHVEAGLERVIVHVGEDPWGDLRIRPQPAGRRDLFRHEY